MNMDKLTNKSREALLSAQNIAVNSGHTELRALHILAGLLADETGLVTSILEKCGVNVALFRGKMEAELGKLPRLEGGNQPNPPASREFGLALNRAMQYAQEMKDEYISVEHLLLGVMAESKETAALLEHSGVTQEKVMQALQSLRGNQRVISNGSSFSSRSGAYNQFFCSWNI